MSELESLDPQAAWATFQGPLDERQVAHLIRRAGFGYPPALQTQLVGQSVDEVLTALRGTEAENASVDQACNRLAQTILASSSADKLSAAWVYRLMQTPDQLREVMTVFWHGHFATSGAKVDDAGMLWQQNQLLRTHALGNFRDLTQAIAQDPAMLVYLDSESNRKAHPNENFARELMELFCLGEGNYTERDVQELSRCFTGWEIRNRRFRKNRYQQDTAEKMVLGQSGPFDGEQAVDIVLSQDAMPRFIAGKLFKFFVCDEPAPPERLLAPLAELLRESDLEIESTVYRILQSRIFFSEAAVAKKIKSPVQLAISLLRNFDLSTNAEKLAGDLKGVGQGLFFPPNVKGWDGGRTWINSSTLLGRSNMMHRILQDENTKFAGGSLTDFLSDQIDAAITNEKAVELFCRQMIAIPLSQSRKQQVASTADGNQPDESALRRLLHAVVSLPECQLV